MGTTTLRALPSLMRNYEGRLNEAVTQTVQKIALVAGDAFARETPVDTGVARSNWVMTRDETFTGVIPAYFPYPSYRVSHHESVKQLVVNTKGGSATRTMNKFRPAPYIGI